MGIFGGYCRLLWVRLCKVYKSTEFFFLNEGAFSGRKANYGKTPNVFTERNKNNEKVCSTLRKLFGP